MSLEDLIFNLTTAMKVLGFDPVNTKEWLLSKSGNVLPSSWFNNKFAIVDVVKFDPRESMQNSRFSVSIEFALDLINDSYAEDYDTFELNVKNTYDWFNLDDFDLEFYEQYALIRLSGITI